MCLVWADDSAECSYDWFGAWILIRLLSYGTGRRAMIINDWFLSIPVTALSIVRVAGGLRRLAGLLSSRIGRLVKIVCVSLSCRCLLLESAVLRRLIG